jgi:hypothetical protein
MSGKRSSLVWAEADTNERQINIAGKIARLMMFRKDNGITSW